MESAREPAVAGQFYPGEASELKRQLSRLLPTARAPAPALAVVVPHAGWMYSGGIAGEVFSEVQVPETAVVLCPNHTGWGVRRSLWSGGPWQYPGAQVEIDHELRELLRDKAGLTLDSEAHESEHAIEVQLPFLQARNPKVRVVPICFSDANALECVATGEGIAQAIRESGRKVLLVASSDMSHYISAERAKKLDALALERVEALDPEGLHRVVREQGITMCGYIPTATVLAAAKALGAKSAQLVRYGNSGEASGDFQRVVGYAGLIIRN